MIKEFTPELLPEVRELLIKANRNILSRTFTGNWLSTFKGRGIEFSDYRQYESGDDASMIDWRASLRARKILVKELTEEKNLNVLIVYDVSNSMLYGSGKYLKAEFAAQVASSISFGALRAGDAVGLVTFTDGIQTFIEPNIGLKQHNIILSIVGDGKTYGGAFDLDKTLSEIMGAMKQRGMLIVISDFIGLSKKWHQYLEIARGRFEIVGINIRDPRDRRLPQHAGEYILEDPYSDKKLIIDCAQYHKPYKEHVQKEEQAIQQAFRMVQGDVLLLEVGQQDYIRDLLLFFHKREQTIRA